MRVLLFGHRGKVGKALAPALAEAGHDVVGVGRGEEPDLSGAEAAVDFTEAGAVRENVARCLKAGIPCVVGTTGFSDGDLRAFDERARSASVPCLVAANFAVGAVLMMRFAEEAARHLPRAEIVEVHHETKRDAPSGTARATAARLPGDPVIHSVRLPGVVAHQEVLLGGPGQLLTIRHDAFSREAFVPGVLLALDRLGALPPGLTLGLDGLLG
ncbi:MAG TPA: dihydrodipicolinate reductase C-terminal domain-containing protein [Gaiellaceae bacterium]|jgi:4-hydroxy-tetrahydrodipicolinate reductase|nr:dihydrodipicolinate reductase C-terminal domain-containing protein [Gaiellaceae bacterium]